MAQAAIVLFVARPTHLGVRVLRIRGPHKIHPYGSPIAIQSRQLEGTYIFLGWEEEKNYVNGLDGTDGAQKFNYVKSRVSRIGRIGRRVGILG